MLSAVLQYGNFLIFLFILVYFTQKPLRAFAKKRHTDFVDAKDEAEQMYRESKRLYDEIQSRLSNLDSEIAERRKKAARQAQEDAEQILAEARILSERMVEDIERLKHEELRKLRESMHAELVDRARAKLLERVKKEVGRDLSSRLLQTQSQDLGRAITEGLS